MKKFLLSLAAVALAGSAWADTAYLYVGTAPTGATTENSVVPIGNVAGNSYTAGDVTFTFEKVNTNTSNVNSNLIRWYANDKIIITAKDGSDISITNVKMTCSTASYNKVAVAEPNNVTGTTSGTEFSVILDNGVTSITLKATAQTRFSVLEVTYTVEGGTVDTRKDAALSFPETECSVNFSEFDSFVAPKLDNPNNLEGITYESSNHGPAMIDENTGILTLYRIAGTTTITATFKGNDDFKPGTASYNLTVVDDRKDAELSFPETEYTVNVDEAFNTPTLNNVYSLPVSFSSSDTNVATVDADGVVTIEGAGTTTITAKFAGNEEYKDGEASYSLKVVDPNVAELGTKENPYTIANLKEMTTYPSGSVWVSGYIVGYMDNNKFTTGTGTVNSNIVIGETASTDNIDKAVPVQLPAGNVRTKLNVKDNKGNIGKEVKVYGSIEKYFSMTGVKNITDYVLNTSVGVESVEFDNNAPKEYYNLQGVRVENPGKGLYIVRQGSKAFKVIL